MAKMGDNQLTHHQVFDVSVDVPPEGGSKCFDDDGRLKRTGKNFHFSNTFYMFNHFCQKKKQTPWKCYEFLLICSVLCFFIYQEPFGLQVLT